MSNPSATTFTLKGSRSPQISDEQLKTNRGKLENRDVTQLEKKTRDGSLEDRLADPVQRKNCVNYGTYAKWLVVALGTTLVGAGIIGLLVHYEQMLLGWSGVGMMSATTSMYVTLVGFGGAFTIGVLTLVYCFINRAKTIKNSDPSEEVKTSWISCPKLNIFSKFRSQRSTD
jgi:hypothetical protein